MNLYPINQNWISVLPQIHYQGGVGMHDGIVIHQTANPRDTAAAERNWEANHFNKRATHFLYCRRLGVTNVLPDGIGTLWGHFQVRKCIGGTDHTDPLDYLKQWGSS